MNSRYSLDSSYTTDNLSFFEKEHYLPSRILQKTEASSVLKISPFDQGFYIEKNHLHSQEEKDFFTYWHQGKQDHQKFYDILMNVHDFESQIHKRFPGAKRFSIEGCDSLIPGLHVVIEKAKTFMVDQIAFGMAHRGRLSVLSTLFGKKNILEEFENHYDDQDFIAGDVKYHKGYDCKKNGIRLTLLSNPSHLESINSVLMGYSKATQALPILIHGDGAFAGQGVVYEMFQLSQLPAYDVKGTIHFVLDNHVAFATSPQDSRSTQFCTDIAKTFQIPVLHVGADDVDAVCSVSEMAFLYRAKFKKDIIIRLSGYRRFGHNEGDDPTFTQPVLYQKIQNHEPVTHLYAKKHGFSNHNPLNIESTPYTGASYKRKSLPSLSKDHLKKMLHDHLKVPEGFFLHPKLSKLHESFLTAPHCTWAVAEKLAFISLLQNGEKIRLSGQDSVRGTFSHRHAMWYDQKTNEAYCPFGENAQFINTPLSEYAAMGFEYGYSLVRNHIIWEAQFGDFSNGAQIIIDQYLSSSFAKWKDRSSLMLMLPHGMEGQGPEHSSARLERFLHLSADHNWIVANVTTPANYYHLLRLERSCPLILMTPKSLLRQAVSSWDDFEDKWQSFFVDQKESDKVIFCSGKIYYDLKKADLNASLVRLEQLYPFPKECLSFMKKKTFWVQEEPKNMGAWSYIRNYIEGIEYIGREESSSPATGYFSRHQNEQENLMNSLKSKIDS